MKISAARMINYKCFADTGDVSLDRINIFAGKNNAGKSAFIRAIHLMQGGADTTGRDLRIGQSSGEVQIHLDDIDFRHFERSIKQEISGTLTIRLNRGPQDQLIIPTPGLKVGPTNEMGVGFSPQAEPDNFIYTYLSKRKVARFEELVNRSRATAVTSDLRYLTSKVDRLANIDHPRSEEYSALCKKVLGFRISTFGSANGHQSGISVGNFDYIPIEAMGEGVSSLLGLITDLCVADGNLFLIEELENDIHPEGLKTILQAIIEKSQKNQFIISTHSNIVTKYLGAAPGSKIFVVESDYRPAQVPTSSIREIEPTPAARIEVLRQLGYELYDFDLWEGWLILEESTAEAIIKDYLIPWFTPKLSRIRTLSAGGTSKVRPTFEDFRRLFLFTHLEEQYRYRAWVLVDGDDTGRAAIEELQQMYGRMWPKDHFRTLTAADFESYYPANFADEVTQMRSLGHSAKPSAKKTLVNRVKQWCDKNEEEAKIGFAKSAAEVIEILKEIESKLFD
ncbi:AAA family ATPase [Herbidospora sp. NEAU-GS84]|uniref:AAA family ATPase n=1 Tax=Herbidospora solisilvae TaxID=2696284 RepID=A0A7C9N5T1_9ACTN|nr:AAA family ATPase [Herbidospora solisilvae]NAS27009.1 AAA family ATPase [Herbidospora solisilvae]